VLIRVTPGVEAHTHEYIETGTDDSKFGFGLQNGEALRAVRRVVEGGRLRFAGLHCHIGSQVFRFDSFAAAADRMVGLVRAVETDLHATVDE
jgi:diaminopimelate decarboxylase